MLHHPEAVVLAKQHPQLSSFAVHQYLLHRPVNNFPPITGAGGNPPAAPSGSGNTNGGGSANSNPSGGGGSITTIYAPFPVYTYTGYPVYRNRVFNDYSMDTTSTDYGYDATVGSTATETLIAREVSPKTPQEKSVVSAVFQKWLVVEPVDNARIRMTYPGDEHPVKTVLFFSEDLTGHRLNLETIEQPPFTAQLPVDNKPTCIGVTVRYKDGFETTLRFPYPVPVSLTHAKRSTAEAK